MRLASVLATAAWLAVPAMALSDTDTIMDGDSAQSGYLPNHNMDPAIVEGGSFGQIWKYATGNGQDQFYAKPLVYTPLSTGRQVVLSFSELNRIFVMDAVNGTLYAMRDLGVEGEVPFLVSDLGNCNDIANTIGITGTPVIDPTTDTVYFWAKSYVGTTKGWQNGAYRLHAVDAATLTERRGFPVSAAGVIADNDASRYFIAGAQLQRTSLNLINGIIYAGFGGHCDQYNFTGWVMGYDTTGRFITAYATEAGPNAPPQDGTYNGGGGGSGIWMSGAGLASDNPSRLYYATGNGVRTQVNQQQPASGRTHLDTLSECVVNMRILPNGTLVQQDYFEPYEYLAMDQADRDLGSGGVCLPDSGTFSGGGVNRLAVTVGKNGKAYILNADNLGGYKLGASGGDAVVQEISLPGGGSVFSNAGAYPLEGGYLYITPVGYPTLVYGLGFTSTGVPSFTYITGTKDSSAGRVGAGSATITTNKGQAGTGILWVVDVDAGIRAYHAVPVNGQMQQIILPASPNVNKFQRPVFGDGRYYLSTSNGVILAFGSPVNLPLTCTSPVDFGSVTIGNSSTLLINCTANIPITSINGLTLGKAIFKASNSSLPKGPLRIGDKFSFPVTFNLSSYSLNGGSTSAPAVSPGVQTTSIDLLTTNGVTGYATDQPISMTGKSVSANAFIRMSPLEVDFAGIVINSTAAESGSDSTFIISNIGQQTLHITGIAWTDGAVNPDPDDEPAVYHNVTTQTADDGTVVSVFDDDGYFTSTNMPVAGNTIAPGTSITVNVNFNSDDIGDFYTTLQVYSDGGNAYTVFTGSASTSPIALLEHSTGEGGWQTIFDCPAGSDDGCSSQIDFGTQPGLSLNNLLLRLTNRGGSALKVTKSKPPEGSVIGAQNPDTELAEGLIIPPGDSEQATLYFDPGPSTLNADPVTYSAVWTFNTDDLTFGVHSLNFTGTVLSNQTGPAKPDSTSRYKYLGCYHDFVNNNRIEPQNFPDQGAQTNGICQQSALTAGFAFAGTEYHYECWTGDNIPDPTLLVSDQRCGFACDGDATQVCGGDGGFMSIYYDSTRYFPANGTLLGSSGSTQPSTGIVQSVSGYNYTGCYSDNTGARSLTGANSVSANGNTLESCAATCAQGAFTIFGVEYGQECYCGNALSNGATLEPDSDCSVPCSGNSTEFCGAGNRLSVYSTNGTVPVTTPPNGGGPVASPQTPQNVSGYTYAGCYLDSVQSRTVAAKTQAVNTNTLESCAIFCSGYNIFGTEYGDECYCGNALNVATIEPDSDCSMPCAGNSSEFCGAANRLTLYRSNGTAPINNPGTTPPPPPSTPLNPQNVSGFSYLGCYLDNTGSRSLSNKVQAVNTNTLESCAAFCSASGYPIFGTEYADECYCGNSISATLEPNSDCSMACAGNSSEYCGAANRLTVYSLNGTNPVLPTPTGGTGPSPTAGPKAPANISTFSLVGCYIDMVGNGQPRTLNLATFVSSDMTLDYCAGNCSSYSYFGVEYADECYCGNTLSGTGRGLATDGRCNMACAGNSTELCGGPNGLTMYYQNVTAQPSPSTTTISATPTPTPTVFTPAVIGNYSYINCRSDNTTIRTLQGYAKYSPDMTLEKCASNCTGYTYFGTEYSQECYCSNSISYGSTNATTCIMPCGGNSTEICGGRNGITLYGLTSFLFPPKVVSSSSRAVTVSSISSKSSSVTVPTTSSKPSGSVTSSSSRPTSAYTGSTSSAPKSTSTFASTFASKSSSVSSISSGSTSKPSVTVSSSSSVLSSSSKASSSSLGTSVSKSSSSLLSSSSLSSSRPSASSSTTSSSNTISSITKSSSSSGSSTSISSSSKSSSISSSSSSSRSSSTPSSTSSSSTSSKPSTTSTSSKPSTTSSTSATSSSASKSSSTISSTSSTPSSSKLSTLSTITVSRSSSSSSNTLSRSTSSSTSR